MSNETKTIDQLASISQRIRDGGRGGFSQERVRASQSRGDENDDEDRYQDRIKRERAGHP